VDRVTERKWDQASRTFDLMSGYGPERRWANYKRDFFARMAPNARILFLAVGTGLDITHFPPGRNIVGIDISAQMLERARPRAAAYPGQLELRQLDVHDLDYDQASFDQIFTSCTFCSVPKPVAGLESLRRVLRPGGELHMFEHTGSRYFPFSIMLRLMTFASRRLGPELDRDTVANVRAAGFVISEVHNVYLDVVKTIHAVAPPA